MISILFRRSWFASKMLWMIVCLALPASPFVFGDAYGQIVRDGSLGQTAGPLTGPNFTIDVQNPGAQIRGANLFHSFSDFNVNTGQSATFTGPSNISNIINRVTGANLSNIDGQLNSQISGANFYLMNPNGVVVGPNASFNISGSVYLTTANYIRFGDEGQLFADLSKTSLLTSAPIVSFGFLGNSSPGRIVIDPGSNDLSVPEGKTISLIGRDVSITGRNLTAPNGKVQVASVGSVNEPPPPPDPEPPPPPDPDCCIESPPAEPDCCLSFSPGYGGEPPPVVSVQSDLKVFNPSEPPLADLVSFHSDFSPGYGGEPPPTGAEVNLQTLEITGGTVGRIAMFPEASLNAGPRGVVQTNPSPANIETPSDSQKVILPSLGQPSLIKVVTAPFLLTISPDMIINEGDTQKITIALDKPAEITEKVFLKNSNSGAATITPVDFVEFNPGQQTQTIEVTGVKRGATEILATLRNVTKSTSVTVDQKLAVDTITAPARLDEGAKGSLSVKLNRSIRPNENPVDVDLVTSGSNGSVSLETTKVRINPGTDTGASSITGELAGQTEIEARLQNATDGPSAIVTVEAIPVEAISDLAIKEDQESTLTVTLARETQRTLRVDLDNSKSTVANIPEPFVIIEEGERSGETTVVGLTAGETIVTVEERPSLDSGTVQVTLLPEPPLSGVGPDLQINVKSGNSIVVSIPTAFKRPITVRLSSSNPNIATVGDSTVIPAGETTSNPVQVAAHQVGRVTITATSGDSSAQAQVSVDIPTTARNDIGLSAAAQYPRAIVVPQATVAMPRLLADRCAGSKDGQFSSFAQLFRDSSPPQPGRYLSSPSILEQDLLSMGRSSTPEISFSIGPPRVLSVSPGATLLAMDACGR